MSNTRWLPLLRNALAVEGLVDACHYVVGNPPWVRIHNIDPNLRARLFEDYDVCKEAGWKFGSELSGAGRGFGRQVDYSIAFVERALEFLAPDGKLAYVITSKWMHALYGNALRKRLLDQTHLIRLVDYSLYGTALFEDATNYPLVMAAVKGRPEKGHRVAAQVVGPKGERREFPLEQQELAVLEGDPEAPWALVPAQVRAAFRKMTRDASGGFRTLLGNMEGSRPRRGVLTSLNEVFLVKEAWPVAENPDDVRVRTEGYFKKGRSEGEKKRYEVRLEKKLLRPLVRGKNIEAWRYTVNDYILWIHDDSGEVLADLPPKAKAYFEGHAQQLRWRDDYKKGPVWQIFRVSPDKLGDKVVWQRVASELKAVFLPGTLRSEQNENLLLIPLDTTRFIPVHSNNAGLVMAGLFNSLPVRVLTASFSRRDRGGYRDFDAWVLGMLPLPEEVRQFLNSNHDETRRIGKDEPAWLV